MTFWSDGGSESVGGSLPVSAAPPGPPGNAFW